METEANQIRASILDMAHCIRTFTDEVSEYSRKLVGIVQQIEGGEQIVEDGVGMAHTEHVSKDWAETCTVAWFPSRAALKAKYHNMVLAKGRGYKPESRSIPWQGLIWQVENVERKQELKKELRCRN